MKKLVSITILCFMLLSSVNKFSAAEIDNTYSEDTLSLSEIISNADSYELQTESGRQVRTTNFDNLDPNQIYILSTATYENKTRTKSTLVHDFYVYHGYMDHVGQTQTPAYYNKYFTSTGQPYYKWTSYGATKVTYFENDFQIKNVSHSASNTSTYKSKSKMKETITWYNNITNVWKTTTVYYYAPANK